MPHAGRSLPALLLAALLIVPAITTAQPASGTTVIGSGLSGRPFVIEDDLVLENLGLYEAVRAYDDPQAPTWLDLYDHSQDGYWQRMLHDDGLVVAVRDGNPGGLDLVDVSDPAAVRPLASLEGTSYTGAWLSGRALVASLPSALLSYDLSDPAAPVFRSVASIADHPGRRWLTGVGQVLLAMAGPATLQAFAAEDPLLLTDLGPRPLDADRIDALAAGDGVLYALLATTANGQTAVDLGTYAVQPDGTLTPTDRRNLVTGREVAGTHLVRRGDLLLAGAGSVHALDLADPAAPAPAWELPLAPDHLEVSARRIFVATGEQLRIYDRPAFGHAPAEPVVRDMLPRLQTIAGSGPFQTAQVYEDRSLLRPIDARNPTHPVLGPAFETGVDGSFVQRGVVGAMRGSEGVLQLLDLTDPKDPGFLGRLQEEATYLNVTLGPQVMALEALRESIELRLYDLADPADPLPTAAIEDFGTLAVGEGLLVVRRLTRVQIYDITDLARPKRASAPGVVGRVLDAVIHRGHIYVLAEVGPGSVVVHALDVADPREPVLISSAPLAHYAADLTLHAQRLYAMGFNWGHILSLSDPAEPQQTAVFPAWGQSGRGLAFNGDVTTVGGWLLSLRDETFAPASAPDQGPPPAAGVILRAAPNPFNPATTVTFALDRAREVTLSVHDLRGRHVADLLTGALPAGEHRAVWRGRDAAGRPVASGAYLLRLHGSGLEALQMITLVK